MSNIIDSIQLSGVTYTLSAQTSGGGNPTVELTQAQYDALVTAGTVQADTYYIITDAQGGDLSNYYTKTETNTLLGGKADTATTYTKTEVDNAITAGTSTKQDTLVSGTNIKTINNESLLGSGNIDIQGGGGGKAIEGGRGISVTTGETADTVSFNLPISAGTGTDSIIGGGYSNKASNSYSVALGTLNTASGESSMAVNDYNVAGGKWSFAGGEGTKALANASFSFGHSTTANGLSSFAIGYGNKTENEREFNCGSNGVSRKASNTFGDSGNTLFVVGNAYYANPRHNAFEIRQNGDIYCSDGTNDVKLQDTITATAANTTALGGLKLVKLSQSEYDSLATKDNSTLYVIVN